MGMDLSDLSKIRLTEYQPIFLAILHDSPSHHATSSLAAKSPSSSTG